MENVVDTGGGLVAAVIFAAVIMYFGWKLLPVIKEKIAEWKAK